MAKTDVTKSQSLAKFETTSTTGDVAARGFACFDRGMRPDEVVTHLVQSADTVEYLWRTWARLRGLVPLSFEVARALREALYSSRPLANGADAVAAVRRFAERPPKLCHRCKDACPEYCTACPGREASRAAARARAARSNRGRAESTTSQNLEKRSADAAQGDELFRLAAEQARSK